MLQHYKQFLQRLFCRQKDGFQPEPCGVRHPEEPPYLEPCAIFSTTKTLSRTEISRLRKQWATLFNSTPEKGDAYAYDMNAAVEAPHNILLIPHGINYVNLEEHVMEHSTELKIKVKHLAAEAKIIREEEQKLSGMEKWNLQHHRKTTVRDAARRSQFAYAIVRGKTLDSTARGYAPDSLKRMRDKESVKKMVRKYGNPSMQLDHEKLVEDWFNG